MEKAKIGYIGTDGRSFLAALETSRATSELYPGEYQGFVVRGTPAMPPFARRMNWPVGFIPVAENPLNINTANSITSNNTTNIPYLADFLKVYYSQLKRQI